MYRRIGSVWPFVVAHSAYNLMLATAPLPDGLRALAVLVAVGLLAYGLVTLLRWRTTLRDQAS
ncbi:hypothetical protein [Streptomyces sp. NBC_00690]|uniref:hypothetical protein n=1 Tax=Streptomyces sp. NBC_00690 TaxID=2975808 RepID=UPI002E2E5E0B|nr:hypothetical protein [Streptomyces sp. NBC_00690]